MSDKYAEAMIELNDFLNRIMEEGILDKTDIINEVENVWHQ